MESKFLHFAQHAEKPGAKTSVYSVASKRGDALGTISWHSPWRRYAFNPGYGTTFDAECLNDIMKFINKLMLDRKVTAQNEKQK